MQTIPAFDFARMPRIVFGAGRIAELPQHVAGFGENVLLVTGARSFRNSNHWSRLEADLAAAGIDWHEFTVAEEPSPALVDTAVAQYHGRVIDVVLGIGGGSVLDAAKAIAGLLPHGNSVMDHLEGVGRKVPYRGPATPFIAVPTTAGTGSEATKNAVLSQQGPDGFKKSFRHEALIAHTALIDPELLASCPPDLMAAQGMDAFTQLLESFVSRRANPMTDALAWSALTGFSAGLFAALAGSADAALGRARIAYGSLVSGICLAQTNLGSVHGLASPLGAFYPIPHGVVCGTLLAEAVDVNIHALRARDPSSPALAKYAKLGTQLMGREPDDEEDALATLVELLRSWVRELELPPLGRFGVTEAAIDHIVAHAGSGNMQTNPVTLTPQETGEILRRRLA